MSDPLTQLLPPLLISLVSGSVAGWLTPYIQRERKEAVWEEQHKTLMARVEDLTQKLAHMKEQVDRQRGSSTSLATGNTKIESMLADIAKSLIEIRDSLGNKVEVTQYNDDLRVQADFQRDVSKSLGALTGKLELLIGSAPPRAPYPPRNR